MKKRYGKCVWTLILLVAVGVLFFAGGYLLHGLRSEPKIADVKAGVAESVWTCSMHPQIREDKPGKCRLCDMDLIPLTPDADDGGGISGAISFSPEAAKLMEIQTSVVERKALSHQVRLVGKIAQDETRTKTITAWVPGRIDRLFVDYTGITVRPGDHMVELYSPELITAQAEFLQSLKSVEGLDDSSELVANSIRQTFQAAREKLALLGLTEQQIADIEKAGKPLDRLTIYAPMGGIVIEKMASEGAYVKTGTPIYTIADLSKLWVLLDAYESDLPWIQYGQSVQFSTPSLPGEAFTGRISFISPVLNDRTRSVKVRAVVENPGGKLKPNMLVSAYVETPVTEQGPSIATDLAGKWICPMHGEIVKDAAGMCDICQMDLVAAETLGLVKEADNSLPLAVPASAVLITGRALDKAVVYAKVEGADKPTFLGKEVSLGPRAGDYYIVKDGLMEGERVVTHGNFKIDSEMQIQARPSMMTSPGEPEETVAVKPGEQTLCPVMDNPINKEVFVEYRGKKVYFCCSGCDETFLADPEKYLPKLPQFQQTLCPVMDNPINKDVFIEYEGKRVYFCCPGCDDAFLKEPEKYLHKLPQFK
ncbi:MAG: efflux RND transporter periplasmic adaptor subunit [Planctomycetota bacterium]|jgi:Cu(I)/Ag(I) efflux system membrane fusion protein